MNDIVNALNKLLESVFALLVSVVMTLSRLAASWVIDPLTQLVTATATKITEISNKISGTREPTENEKLIGCILYGVLFLFLCYLCYVFSSWLV